MRIIPELHGLRSQMDSENMMQSNESQMPFQI